MAAGAYSSIFIATPLLAHLKSREPDVQEQEKRVKARRRHEADRYAAVPAFTDDMPIAADPDAVAVRRCGPRSSGGDRAPAATAPLPEHRGDRPRPRRTAGHADRWRRARPAAGRSPRGKPKSKRGKK